MFNYTTYLLRCWQDDRVLRLRLENPITGEKWLFENVADLCAHVAQSVATSSKDTAAQSTQGDTPDDSS